MRALVDSGSTDVDTWMLNPNVTIYKDLQQSKISSLKLEVDKAVPQRPLGPLEENIAP